MNVKEESICRLCFKVAEEFQIVDDTTRKMFEVLLLRVNLDISKHPIICKDCAGVVEKCFNFKSSIDKKRATFESKDIYKDGKDIETVNNFLCRFCWNHLSDSNFVLLDKLMKDVTFVEMLQLLMPAATDFNVIKNSVICSSCRQDLECYIQFLKNCLDVEEKITKYFQNKFVQVKLSEIQHCEKLEYTRTSVIKKEEDPLEDIGKAPSEVYNGELVKAEEVLHIKDEVNFDETSSEIPSNMPVYKINIPNGLKRQETSTKNDSCTTTANYTKSMCDTIQHCIKYDTQSDMIPSETGRDTPYQIKNKGKVNKKNYTVITKNFSEAQIFKCAMCTYETKHKGSFKTHILKHKDNTEVKMYKCSMCSHETKHKTGLIRHMLIHKDITEVEVYKCSMCTYKAKRKEGLIRHITLIHKDITEVETYNCSMCTYQAKQKGNLKIHMLIHKDITEVEMYKCSMCTHQTKYKSSFMRHLLIHKDKVAEVKMYKCSMCTYQTRDKSNFKKHMLIHKDIKEVEMYECAMCTYKSKQKGGLKRHMLIHKDVTEVDMYKCSVCAYRARERSKLKSHMLIHKDIAEVAMHKCSMCTFETKHKYSLKCHTLIHKDVTEVEMYKCLMCTYETKHKRALKKHTLIHNDITAGGANL